jgi:peptide methionine sulfoxide reductase MsrA
MLVRSTEVKFSFITLFKKQIEDYIALMTSENTFGKPIVTKISAASIFYTAEEYHQNYYNQNKSHRVLQLL